ncbi:ribonuclease H-like domain protein [Vibrio phage 1.063.O._10N.261.45.C7]|nr:ribonuclease H-like domain protein [Vibrio phage 1.063.O._10N.261.45.C7]
MKQIKNWKLATVFDLEGDGLEATLFHVFSFHMVDGRKGHIDGSNHDRFRAFLNYHMDNEIPIVAHNGILFDTPTCERLLDIDLSRLMLIDTMALSWYLNTKRKAHGLGTFLNDYGIPKPVVGECEWVIPIRGISLSMRKEGKGADEVKIMTYKYLDESLVPVEDLPEDYKKKGLDPETLDFTEVGLLESEEDHQQRIKEHKELMILRCNEDVKINLLLWQDFMKRLHEMYTITKACIDSGQVNPKRMSDDEETYLDQYVNSSTVDEYIERCLTFLMFKMDCARLQEKTRWKADVEYIEESYRLFTDKVETAKGILEGVMPPVPKYTVRKKPKGDPLKKDGTPKVATVKWNDTVDQFGMEDHLGNLMVIATEDPDVVKLLTKYENPNANSSDQLKSWLFSHGWVPETFEYVKDEAAMEKWVAGGFRKEDKPVPRKVPQINKQGDEGKELCHSVIKLAEEVPEVMAYDSYTVVKTRLDTIKGFRRSMSEDGYLKARIGAFTNTLRVGHRELANLAGIDKPYGENIRGALTCNEGEILLGSDLSSLEDRVKHHFMLPHDPQYVETMMADDYDPHILTAYSAKMVTDEELAGFKAGTLSGAIKDAVGKARKGGKVTNYASVYGGSPEAISRGGGIDLNLAKQLHKGYWELNWSVKAIAEEQCVFEDSRKQKWLINPVNGIAYSLRTEKDRFSTLCQGTGSYFFDMWVDEILTAMEKKWGKKTLTGSFHDEIILCFKDLPQVKEAMTNIVMTSIDKVTDKYKLRRKLGADVQLNTTYAGIH